MILQNRSHIMLNGDENLATLLEKYTDTQGFHEKELLPNIKRIFGDNVLDTMKEVEETLSQIATESFFPVEKDTKARAVYDLLGEYFHANFGHFYNVLDDELFNLKRVEETSVSVRGNVKNISVSLPLFAKLDIGSKEEYWTFSAKYGHGDRHTSSYEEYEVEVRSKIPPISSKARKEVREAMRLYYNTCVIALKKQPIGDFLLWELLNDQNELVKEAELNFTIYWIPTPDELKITARVVDKDPFISAELFGRNYLIAKWDVKGEKPFEHYLREYTK